MIKNISDLKNVLSNRQRLTSVQMLLIKGGDGDDKRRDDDPNARGTNNSNGNTGTTGTTTSTVAINKPAGS
jgi:hypothetical protein